MLHKEINFNSDSNPGRPLVRHAQLALDGRQNEKREWDDDSHRCKMQITLQDFRDFRGAQTAARKTKRWKKEREGGRWMPGRRDITEQPLHTHCGHPASLLFHATKYRVLFTRRFQPRVENSPLVQGMALSRLIHLAWKNG